MYKVLNTKIIKKNYLLILKFNINILQLQRKI